MAAIPWFSYAFEMIPPGFVNMTQYRPSGAKLMIICHVKSEGIFLKFWAWPQSSADVVREIDSQFYRISSELDSASGFIRNNQTPIGLKCAVKSKNRQTWCRARVTATFGVSEILVQLIDYGIEETVSVADARKIDEYFFRHPPLAVECILADVEPYYGDEWTPEAVRFCEHHLVGQTLSCFAVSDHMKIPVVRVAKQGESQPFVQRLIDSNLARIRDENRQVSFKMNALEPNSTPHLVKVSYVETPYNFFVQLISAEMELKNMMNALQKYSETEQLPFVNSPFLHMPCLTRSASTACYYRSLVTGIHNGCFKVLFVDYGYYEMKEFQDLKVLPPRFFELAAQAIRCSIPREIEVDVADFSRATTNKQFTCHVLKRVGDIHIVNLQEQGRELIAINSVQPIQIIPYKQQKLAPGQLIEVTISSINDINEFFCQITSFREQLKKMSQILNSGLDFLPLSLAECEHGMPVCVKYSDDNMWYRAQITKINNESDIEVFFVDYGNNDNANLRDVRKMIPDLMQFQTQAFKCSLYDVHLPDDQSMRDEMFDIFEELTTGQTMTAQVKKVSEDIKYDVILLEKNGKVSINEKLESNSLTIGIVPVSDIENLFVTHFEAPDSFFAQFEKLDSNKLSQMQEEINEYYCNAKNSQFKPKVKNLVCAKFLEDEQFYRARVDVVKDSACEVSFIDYGNKEQVSLADIHPMNKKFAQYPQFGITCALEKFPAATPVEKLSSLMVDNPIQARMLREQSGKWLISLTENFANNVPILELLRQHELVVPRSIHGAGLGGFQSKIAKEDSYPSHEVVQRNSWQEPLQNDRRETRKPDFEKPFFSKQEPDAEPKSVASIKNYDITRIPPNAYRNVYVSHVISPSEFYCQIEEENSKLLSLMKDIEDSYANINDNELNFKDFTANVPCCAVFEDDGAWYRGKIQKVNSTSCEVFFVDYGNVSTVPKSKIKVLLGNLVGLPVQAFCCKSYNVSPKSGSWSDADIDAFTDMTLDKSFVAQFVECENGIYSVNLVNIGKLQEDVLSKEFVSLGHGRLEDTSKILVLNSHAASSNLSFSPIDISLNSSEAVEVTYGLNPGEIYCQLKSHSNNFKTMMEKLQNYYKRSDPESLIDRPHQGMICVAQFFQDSAWYRATIKKVEKSSITVFYVDYGNSEAVDKKKIRGIIQDFTVLPIQAIKCHLKGIKPPGKSWQINNSIGKYYEGDTWCKFLAKANGYYEVEMTCDKKNVISQLVQDGLAVFDGPSPEKTKEISAVKTDKRVCQSIVIPNRELNFVHGQLLTVSVSYTESPAKFWCQLVDESDVLDNLMADIEAAYQEPSIPFVNIASLTVNSYCMAKYSEDEAWYRAQVKSLPSCSDCEVFFIDYGNSEVVSGSQVASLLPEFTKHPPQCFECKLLNSPSLPNAENTKVFQDLVGEAEELTATVLSIINNVCTVALTYDVDNEEVNVAEVLFGKKDVSSTLCEPVKFLAPDIPLGLHDGYVSTVNTPQDFFIQLANSEEALTAFATELAESCDKMVLDDSTVAQPIVGQACCAKYSEDNSWYRAEIISLQDSSADVLFIDYGNAENVPLHSLKILNAKFLEVPPYAIKCKLNGIVPIKEPWTDDVINTFHEMVDDCLLGVTFISKDIPAIVNLTKEDKDIAQSLVDMELANVDTSTETGEAYAEDHLTAPIEDQPCSFTNDQSYPRRKFAVGSKLLAKICYVDSCDRFYITPVDFSTNLDTVTHLLKILYGDKEKDDQQSFTSQVLEDIKPLMPCVAKYSEDEAWYRALVTEIDGDNICVTFVDYGNSEIISLDNLKPITRELFEVPVVATECSLFGMQAVEAKEKEITDKLEEFYVDEVELELEICQCNPLKVKLCHNGADFITDLINEGLATAVECSVDSNVPLITEIVNESSPSSNIVSPPTLVDLETNPVSIKFYEIEDNVVILHAVPIDLNEELENLQAHLNDVYSEMEREPSTLENMAFCVAKYSEDESWYRAQILSIDAENVKVKFIDYGNSEVINVKDINVLTPEFTQKPQFSSRFILSCYKVINDKKDEVCGTLDECIYEEGVQLKPCKHSHNVHGLCVSSVLFADEDIFETMLKNELVTLQFPVNHQVGSTFVGTVEKYLDGEFFIIPLELQKERENLQAELQNLCTFDETCAEIDQKRFYAVKKSDHWYRAAVMTLDGDTAVVKLVDFESILVVQTSKLIVLPSCVHHQPVLLQPCRVEGLESISAAFIDKFASVIVNNKIPVACSLLDSSPKCYPLRVKLYVNDVEMCDILKNVTNCDEIVSKIEENAVEESMTTADNIKQEVCINDNPDTEIEVEEFKAGGTEEKALLNNAAAQEESEITVNNSEDFPSEENISDRNLSLESDAQIGETSEGISSEKETEVLPSVDDVGENVEFLAEQKSDLDNQNVVVEDGTVPEEFTALESISEDSKQIETTDLEVESLESEFQAVECTEFNNSPQTNTEFSPSELKDNTPFLDEELNEDKSKTNDAEVLNIEEIEESICKQNIKHEDSSECNINEVEDVSKVTDKISAVNESPSELEDNTQFLNEESNEDKSKIDDAEAGNIAEIDQSICKQNIKHEEHSSECNINEVEDVSKVTDEISAVSASQDKNEEIQADSMQILEGTNLECAKSENKEVIDETFDKCSESNLSENEFQDQVTDNRTVESSQISSVCNIQKVSEVSVADDMNKSEDEGIRMKSDKDLTIPLTEYIESVEVELQHEAIINAAEGECKDKSFAIEHTDASESKSQAVDKSSNFSENTTDNLNTTSDEHKESAFKLQAETIISTAEDECQDKSCTNEHTDVSKSQSVDKSSNISENATDNLNATSDEHKESVEAFRPQAETIISTAEDECQDKSYMHEHIDASESPSQTIDESSNFSENTTDNSYATSDDHKESLEVSKLKSETISEFELKRIGLGDTFESDVLPPFEMESVLETSFEASDAKSAELLGNRHISGKIGAIVSEVSISENSIILAVTPSNLLDELSQLSNSLQNTYSSKDTPFEKSSFSQMCAILSDDNLWYRAKILDMLDEDSIVALLIDNGSWKTTDVTKFRNLEPEHVCIPPFAIWCTLTSASCLDNKAEEVKEYLKTLAKDKLVEIKVIDEEEPFKVSLFVDGVNVLNELLKKNLIIQTLPVNYDDNVLHNAKTSYCHVSKSDITLFIKLTEHLETSENLKKCMQDSYNTEAFEVPSSESSVCAVFYKDLWLRAQVLSSEANPCAKLIDLGESVYDVQNFYALLPEHCLHPPFAIPCLVSLTHELDAELSEALKNLLESSNFMVRLETLRETQSVCAIIVDKDLINKVKEFGVCFEHSISTSVEISIDNDNEKDDCLKLICKELDDVKIDALNEMTKCDSTKEYVSLLNESFSSDSSIDIE